MLSIKPRHCASYIVQGSLRVCFSMFKTNLHHKQDCLQFWMRKLRFKKVKILAQEHSWSVNGKIWIQVSLTLKCIFLPPSTALLNVKEQSLEHRWSWERTCKYFIQLFPVPKFPVFDLYSHGGFLRYLAGILSTGQVLVGVEEGGCVDEGPGAQSWPWRGKV